MRISDWSSDVCSSDLEGPDVRQQRGNEDAPVGDGHAVSPTAAGLLPIQHKSDADRKRGGRSRGGRDQACLAAALRAWLSCSCRACSCQACSAAWSGRPCSSAAILRTAASHSLATASSIGRCRVGNEGCSPCRTRVWTYTKKK